MVKKRKKLIFFILMWCGIIGVFITSVLSSGKTINNLLFCQENQTFMDFFECIVYGRHPYEVNGSYPPLAFLIFAIFGRLIPLETRMRGGYAVRESQMGMFSVGIFLAVSFFLIQNLINKYYRGKLWEKNFFLVTFILSTPMLFLIERANIVFLVVPAVAYFIFNYDSEIIYKRHFAYICLSIAAGIKIYPAVLGLLVVQRRKAKEICLCLVYGIIIFFAAFIFFDGIFGITGFWNNLVNSLQVIGGELGYGYKINITNTFSWIGKIFGDEIFFSKLGNIVYCMVIVLGVVITLFGKFKQKWKRWMIPILLMLLLPGFSFIYSLTFLVIPLIGFFNEKQSRGDNFYAVLYALSFIPIIVEKKAFLKVFEQDYYLLNYSTVIESVAILIFIFSLFFEGGYALYKNRNE